MHQTRSRQPFWKLPGSGVSACFTLKDSPGAKGKKERVFSAGPHFPARRALRWTALSGKLTFSWSPTSPSVSSSCGALDRVTSMLRRHREGRGHVSETDQGAGRVYELSSFGRSHFCCRVLENSDIFWSSWKRHCSYN